MAHQYTVLTRDINNVIDFEHPLEISADRFELSDTFELVFHVGDTDQDERVSRIPPGVWATVVRSDLLTLPVA